MAIQLIAAPVAEPVSLAEAKAQCRVDPDLTAEDLLLELYIASARQAAETITRRALVTQSWRLVVDRFPSPMAARLTDYWLGQQWGLGGMGGVSVFPVTDKTGYGFLLPLSSLISVDGIQYIDTGGVLQTMPPADYKVDPASEPPRILPAYGKAWPSTRQEASAVQISFTAGYGGPSAVPAAIKHWMLLHIACAYENRSSAVIEKGSSISIPFADRLLDPFRVYTF